MMWIDPYELPKESGSNMSFGKSANLKGKSIVSVADLSDADLDYLFKVVQGIKNRGRAQLRDILYNKVLACLFYEASTRTSSSFIAAATRLGASVIPITQGVEYSSVSKGETLEDTVRTLAQYADVIVLRHPEIGSASRAAQATARDGIPVINAGDGAGDHPTQALTDLYTIIEKSGAPNGKTFTFVGDLKYSRTVHSLIKLLARFPDVDFTLVSPKDLELPTDLYKEVAKTCEIETASSLKDVIEDTDVVYVVRPQIERMSMEERNKGFDWERFRVDAKLMEKADPSTIVLHPFPRTLELSSDFDNDKRAVYFDQIKNGMYLKMGLLACLLGAEAGLT